MYLVYAIICYWTELVITLLSTYSSCQLIGTTSPCTQTTAHQIYLQWALNETMLLSTVLELVFLQLLITNASLLGDETCMVKSEKYVSVFRNELQQCPKGKSVFDLWRFSANSILRTRFPIDSIEQNYVRKVSNVIFSVVKPSVLSDIKLVAVSSEALTNILDLDPAVKYDTLFLNFAAGNWIHPSGVYLAHRYGGHQVVNY